MDESDERRPEDDGRKSSFGEPEFSKEEMSRLNEKNMAGGEDYVVYTEDGKRHVIPRTEIILLKAEMNANALSEMNTTLQGIQRKIRIMEADKK